MLKLILKTVVKFFVVFILFSLLYISIYKKISGNVCKYCSAYKMSEQWKIFDISIITEKSNILYEKASKYYFPKHINTSGFFAIITQAVFLKNQE